MRMSAGFCRRRAIAAKGCAISAEKLKGFDSPEAVLTGRRDAYVRRRCACWRGAGTCRRTVSPDCIPAGEGAGYAGGIVSAAVDGIKCAEALIAPNSPGRKRSRRGQAAVILLGCRGDRSMKCETLRREGEYEAAPRTEGVHTDEADYRV